MNYYKVLQELSLILKYTNKSNTRHKALCGRILLNLLVRRYKTEYEDNEKQKLLERCSVVMEKLCEDIHKMENENVSYSWLIIPLLYIKCGHMHVQCSETSNPKAPLQWFEKAIQFEQSRSASWNGLTFEGFVGKI